MGILVSLYLLLGSGLTIGHSLLHPSCCMLVDGFYPVSHLFVESMLSQGFSTSNVDRLYQKLHNNQQNKFTDIVLEFDIYAVCFLE